jgi:hypothetical protein
MDWIQILFAVAGEQKNSAASDWGAFHFFGFFGNVAVFFH